MTLRAASLLAACLVASGCGGARDDGGEASLWITRDRGEKVLFAGTVASGLTVMQAVRREADVETRYGGRFVQSIEGISSSGRSGSDWFYFVNGIAADRGAAEYRLRRGDIAWWDYHRWRGRPELRIVVGAFPEPFLHGFRGKRRPAVVRYRWLTHAAAARTLGRRIAAVSVAPASVPAPAEANVLAIEPGAPGFSATLTSPEGPYRFVLRGDPAGLARNPRLVRFRFEGLP